MIDLSTFRQLTEPNIEYAMLDLDGNLYHKNIQQVFEPQILLKKGKYRTLVYYGYRFTIRKGISRFIRIEYLVASAWYKESPKVWKNSKYAEHINRYHKFWILQTHDLLKCIGSHKSSYRDIYYVCKLGSVWNYSRRYRLCTNESEDGYLKIKLPDREWSLARLVAECFCERPPHLKDIPFSQLQVNHLDRNTKNNKWTNLEWCTGQENVQHAWRNGRPRIDGKQMIPDDVMDQIGRWFYEGKSDFYVTKMTGIREELIFAIRHLTRPRYRDIHRKYPWKPWKEYLKNYVIPIIELFLSGKNCYQISKQLFVSRLEVGKIIKRKLFFDMSEPYAEQLYQGYLRNHSYNCMRGIPDWCKERFIKERKEKFRQQ